ncbi:MAG: hypothetical protein HYY24_22235 [Verrucomicrobia bacterium]|nr:hypothetical protein [Verrucomicrobiota bacterium]
MTTTAERLVEELGKLPPAELREVWQRVGPACDNGPSAPPPDQRAALEVVHSLYGRFAGGNSLVHLLQERARDRAREEVELRRLSRRHG